MCTRTRSGSAGDAPGGPVLPRAEQTHGSFVSPGVDELYATWRPRLLSLCRQLLRHDHDAEEAAAPAAGHAAVREYLRITTLVAAQLRQGT
jgi:hypothetical protein